MQRAVLDYDQEDPAADDNNPDAAAGSQNNPLSNQLEQIIQRLPTCVNRNFIDDVSTCKASYAEIISESTRLVNLN